MEGTNNHKWSNKLFHVFDNLTSSLVVWSLVVRYVWKPASPITDQIDRKQMNADTRLNGACWMTSTNSCFGSSLATRRESKYRSWYPSLTVLRSISITHTILDGSANMRKWKLLETPATRWTCRRTDSFVYRHSCRPANVDGHSMNRYISNPCMAIMHIIWYSPMDNDGRTGRRSCRTGCSVTHGAAGKSCTWNSTSAWPFDLWREPLWSAAVAEKSDCWVHLALLRVRYRNTKYIGEIHKMREWMVPTNRFVFLCKRLRPGRLAVLRPGRWMWCATVRPLWTRTNNRRWSEWRVWCGRPNMGNCLRWLHAKWLLIVCDVLGLVTLDSFRINDWWYNYFDNKLAKWQNANR